MPLFNPCSPCCIHCTPCDFPFETKFNATINLNYTANRHIGTIFNEDLSDSSIDVVQMNGVSGSPPDGIGIPRVPYYFYAECNIPIKAYLPPPPVQPWQQSIVYYWQSPYGGYIRYKLFQQQSLYQIGSIKQLIMYCGNSIGIASYILYIGWQLDTTPLFPTYQFNDFNSIFNFIYNIPGTIEATTTNGTHSFLLSPIFAGSSWPFQSTQYGIGAGIPSSVCDGTNTQLFLGPNFSKNLIVASNFISYSNFNPTPPIQSTQLKAVPKLF